MSVAEIEKELRRMNNAERIVIIELATKFIKAEYQSKSDEKQKLRQSAEIMREEYLNDAELTSLNVLDEEDFVDA